MRNKQKPKRRTTCIFLKKFSQILLQNSKELFPSLPESEQMLGLEMYGQ